MKKLLTILFLIALAMPASAANFPDEMVGFWCPIRSNDGSTYFKRVPSIKACSENFLELYMNGNFDRPEKYCMRLISQEQKDLNESHHGWLQYKCSYQNDSTDIRSVKWTYASGRLKMQENLSHD
jgi:hypothetical protein